MVKISQIMLIYIIPLLTLYRAVTFTHATQMTVKKINLFVTFLCVQNLLSSRFAIQNFKDQDI